MAPILLLKTQWKLNFFQDRIKTYEVEDVVSLPVCTEICLHQELYLQVNSWTYDPDTRLCSCNWLRTIFCFDYEAFNVTEIKEPSIVFSNSTNQMMFLQVAKILPCGIAKKTFLNDKFHMFSHHFMQNAFTMTSP